VKEKKKKRRKKKVCGRSMTEFFQTKITCFWHSQIRTEFDFDAEVRSHGGRKVHVRDLCRLCERPIDWRSGHVGNELKFKQTKIAHAKQSPTCQAAAMQ
jgi:hypothetical protein